VTSKTTVHFLVPTFMDPNRKAATQEHLLLLRGCFFIHKKNYSNIDERKLPIRPSRFMPWVAKPWNLGLKK